MPPKKDEKGKGKQTKKVTLADERRKETKEQLDEITKIKSSLNAVVPSKDDKQKLTNLKSQITRTLKSLNSGSLTKEQADITLKSISGLSKAFTDDVPAIEQLGGPSVEEVEEVVEPVIKQPAPEPIFSKSETPVEFLLSNSASIPQPIPKSKAKSTRRLGDIGTDTSTLGIPDLLDADTEQLREEMRDLQFEITESADFGGPLTDTEIEEANRKLFSRSLFAPPSLSSDFDSPAFGPAPASESDFPPLPLSSLSPTRGALVPFGDLPPLPAVVSPGPGALIPAPVPVAIAPVAGAGALIPAPIPRSLIPPSSGSIPTAPTSFIPAPRPAINSLAPATIAGRPKRDDEDVDRQIARLEKLISQLGEKADKAELLALLERLKKLRKKKKQKN